MTPTPPVRARELGIAPGILPTGPLNAITDVHHVSVGHITVIEGNDVRTGATAILPHSGNIYQEKVPAGVAVGNGYGKLMGSTQIEELGEIETPILLTNTLSVPRAGDALLDWTLAQPGNESVRSVNMVVGETNDGYLNNIRKRVLTPEILRHAIDVASRGLVDEGCVGAGTGTVAFGWKGGIGTSSRLLPQEVGNYTVGVLVQSNYGGVLQVLGEPVGVLLDQYYGKEWREVRSSQTAENNSPDGSIMIIIATDAPLSDRNLTRLARRGLAGLARTGASMSDGSGDYVIAFSSEEAIRRTAARRAEASIIAELPNEHMSPLFQAAIEATEEAILNSLFMAHTMSGYKGRTVKALPTEQILAVINTPMSHRSKK
ncbi:MAG: P1 family peptidase [Chloroflexota bacterium]